MKQFVTSVLEGQERTHLFNFEWKRSKFTGEKPIAPWHFVTLKEAAALKSDADQVVELVKREKDWGSDATTPISVRLAWVTSASSAFLVRAEKWNEMEEMYRLMQCYADDSKPGVPFCNVLGAPGYTRKKLLENPVRGMVAMVKGHPEDGYVRAMITEKVEREDDKWKVKLLDFGDLMQVSGSDIFHLPHRFAQLPFTAIRVRLENVHPLMKNRVEVENLLVEEGGFLPEDAERVITDIREWALKRFVELAMNKELVCKFDFEQGTDNELTGLLYSSVEAKDKPSHLLSLSEALAQEMKIKFPLFLECFEEILAKKVEENEETIPEAIAEHAVLDEDYDNGVQVED